MPFNELVLPRAARRQALFGLFGVILAFAGGCADPHAADLPPLPLGFSSRTFQERQVAKAAAGRFVVYRGEWSDEPAGSLSPAGRRHVERIAQGLRDGTSDLLTIEPSGVASLDAARQAYVTGLLANLDVPRADARVVVAEPASPGMLGEEAADVIEHLPRAGEATPNVGGALGTTGAGAVLGTRPGGF